MRDIHTAMHNGDEKLNWLTISLSIVGKIYRVNTYCLEWCRWCHHLYSRNRWKCSKRSFFYYQWNQLVYVKVDPGKERLWSCRRYFYRWFSKRRYWWFQTDEELVIARDVERFKNHKPKKREGWRRKPQSSYILYKKEVVHEKYGLVFVREHPLCKRMPSSGSFFCALILSLTISSSLWFIPFKKEWCKVDHYPHSLGDSSGSALVFICHRWVLWELRCSAITWPALGRNFFFFSSCWWLITCFPPVPCWNKRQVVRQQNQVQGMNCTLRSFLRRWAWSWSLLPDSRRVAGCRAIIPRLSLRGRTDRLSSWCLLFTYL